MFEITSIRITKLESESNIKGIVSIIFNNQFVVKSIRIAENNGSLFLLFPNKNQYSSKSRFKETYVHPINQDVRTHITDTVVNCFNQCKVGWNQFDFETNQDSIILSQVIFYDSELENITKSVSLVFDESLVIHDITLTQVEEHLYINYPEVMAHGRNHSIGYPYSKEIENRINQLIIELYQLDVERGYRKYINKNQKSIEDATVLDYSYTDSKNDRKK